jgi:hypothetical protein
MVSNPYCVVFFVHFECPMLSVSLDCAFVIPPRYSRTLIYKMIALLVRFSKRTKSYYVIMTNSYNHTPTWENCMYTILQNPYFVHDYYEGGH